MKGSIFVLLVIDSIFCMLKSIVFGFPFVTFKR